MTEDNKENAPRSARKFSFISSIGPLVIETRVPMSFAMEIHANKPESDRQTILRLLLRTARINDAYIDLTNAEKLMDDEIDHICLEIVKNQKIEIHPDQSMQTVLAKYIFDKGSVSSDSQLQAAIALSENLKWTKDVTRPVAQQLPESFKRMPIPERNEAKRAIDKVLQEVEARRADLRDKTRIISLMSISAPGGSGFLISDMRPEGDYVILTGVITHDVNASPKLVQHYTQLNVLITDIPQYNKVGFTDW